MFNLYHLYFKNHTYNNISLNYNITFFKKKNVSKLMSRVFITDEVNVAG